MYLTFTDGSMRKFKRTVNNNRFRFVQRLKPGCWKQTVISNTKSGWTERAEGE